ncbi:MAG: M18 family aminopeptidase [Clostridia bacterium]|nr:M18 family aminopeptidase [Clostridia bacterium]
MYNNAEYVNTNKELFDFIDKSPSPFHAVENMRNYLKENGFTELSEKNKWKGVITAGGKYFAVRNNSSVIAFTVPQNTQAGFSILAAHSDSPTFKIKELSDMKVEGNYTKLNTEGYGGMIMSTWFDKPLSVAGRLIVKTENGTATKLVDIDRDFCAIPNLAIHMNREINNGYKYNAQKDMLPLIGNENADLAALLAESAGVNKEDILSSDVFLYNRQKGTFFGADNEFIMCPKLDDLQCAFSAMKAITESAESDRIKVSAVFDNEEVGSGTKQGAGSTFLYDTLTRINSALGGDNEDFICRLSDSFMVSCDNAHAVHPNYTDKTDPTNRNYLNKGLVIKFNANQKYTTDGVSAGIFKTICDRNEVPYQVFHNRSDMPGGSTLGNISNAHVSLNTIDIGIPQLAMHSSCETAGAKDTFDTIKALKAFLEADITETACGEYSVK